MNDIPEGSNMTTGDNEDSHNLAFYRFVIDSLPTAVFTVDGNLKITGFNPLAEKITEYTKDTSGLKSPSFDLRRQMRARPFSPGPG